MNILGDMNLSPDWIPFLESHDCDAVHWSTLGDPRAKDSEIMERARENDYVIFTHDLDFGHLLAHTRKTGPSVIQLRAQNVTPGALGNVVVSAVRQFEVELVAGCLLTIDVHSSRVRICQYAK